MKKIAKILGFISILTTMLSASVFESLSYGQNIEDRVLYDEDIPITFQDSWMIKYKIGIIDFDVEMVDTNRRIGLYSDIGFSQSNDRSSHIYEGYEENFRETSYLFNLGTGYAFNNYIVLFGGLGVDYSRAEISESTTINEEEADKKYFDEYKFNMNVGLITYFYESRFGLIVEYDSAPKIVSVGLAHRF